MTPSTIDTPHRAQDPRLQFDSAAKDFNFESIFTENAFSGVDRVSDGHQLTAGVTAAGFSNSSNNQGCSGNENASLIVTITGTSLATASAGSYSGVLSITIVPN